MPKNIQLSDSVYARLDGFRGKRETFSEAVGKLLTLMEKMGELTNILEGGVRYEDWKREQLEKQAQAH